MQRFFHLALPALLALATTLVSAQELDPNSVVNAGAQVTKMVDDGRYAEVWEGGSAVMKKVAARAAFTASVAKARQSFGASATQRVWLDVSRRDSAGTPELPAGVYMNVGYRATFANGKTAHELVSFRLDEDKTWRVTGYVLN